MEKKQYIAPMCEVAELRSAELMKITEGLSPGGMPPGMAPRRRTKVFWTHHTSVSLQKNVSRGVLLYTKDKYLSQMGVQARSSNVRSANVMVT